MLKLSLDGDFLVNRTFYYYCINVGGDLGGGGAGREAPSEPFTSGQSESLAGVIKGRRRRRSSAQLFYKQQIKSDWIKMTLCRLTLAAALSFTQIKFLRNKDDSFVA